MTDPLATAGASVPAPYSLVSGDSVDPRFFRETIAEELDAIQAHDRRPRVRQLVAQLREMRSIDPKSPFDLGDPFILLDDGAPVARFILEDGFQERRFLDVWVATSARGRGVEAVLAALFAAEAAQATCPIVAVVALPDADMAAALEAVGFVPDLESETHRRYRSAADA